MIEGIRAKIAAGLFEFSKHAVDQSILRRISVQELHDAVGAGEIIEDYPDDKYGPSCLVFGVTIIERPLHIQCSYPSRPLLKIITLYEPDEDLGSISGQGSSKMKEETMRKEKVTYTLEIDGKCYIIENVPASVSEEAGEQFFSPETVERLQNTIWGHKKPKKTIETPIFEFAA